MSAAAEIARDDRRERRGGFFRRSGAMLIKEFIQLRRDRVSFAMIVMVPLMQLLLFGYAINTTPRDLPTAVQTMKGFSVRMFRMLPILVRSTTPMTEISEVTCN